jgi:hypothetical protein|tara:strand:+ start:41 stop:322 length:282 start_codon:yes stop_codon:yes gene_type:complete
MNNVYEKALDIYNTGLFLKLEGSFGRCFVDNFLDSGIIKTIDEPGNKIVDGYGREIQLRKAVIDKDRIDDLWVDRPDFVEHIEELWSGFPSNS